jgi:hypothetical protein
MDDLARARGIHVEFLRALTQMSVQQSKFRIRQGLISEWHPVLVYIEYIDFVYPCHGLSRLIFIFNLCLLFNTAIVCGFLVIYMRANVDHHSRDGTIFLKSGYMHVRLKYISFLIRDELS